MARSSPRLKKSALSTAKKGKGPSHPTEEELRVKREYEQYRRRRWCVFDKSLDLKRLCKAKVFLLVVDEDERRKHMLSTEPLSQTWPPSGIHLVR
jgi:hypothetical protein